MSAETQIVVGTYPAESSVTRPGGQAPPTAAGGSVYRVRVTTMPSRATAEGFQASLNEEGFLNSELVPLPDGKFAVMIDAASSEEDALEVQKALKAAGFDPEAIQAPGAAVAAAPTEESQIATGNMTYRVLVAEMPSQAEAEEARTRMVEEGFATVDIVEKGGQFQVLMGSFPDKTEAEKVGRNVKAAGFNLADITLQQKLAATSADVASVDLGGLTEQQKAETKTVLEEISKTAGSSSAAEIEALRAQIQQLTDEQKDVIKRFEVDQTRQRENQQKIYQYYREFEMFTQSRNLEGAEQTLAKVRAIDPNDMYLASKVDRLQGLRQSTATTPDGTRTANGPDPAKVAELLAAARTLKAESKNPEAISAFDKVLEIDPTNTEAKGQLAELRKQQEVTESGAVPVDRTMYYIIGGAVGLVLLGLGWFLFGRKTKPSRTAAASAGESPGMASLDVVDPLSPGGMSVSDVPETSPMLGGLPSSLGINEPAITPTPQPMTAPVMTGGLMGSGFDMNSMPTLTAEQEDVPLEDIKPIAPPAPEEPESDTVSLDSMFASSGMTPATGSPSQPTPTPAESSLSESSPFSLDSLDLALPGAVPASESALDPLQAFQMPGAPEPLNNPAPAEAAFDIESLLKGTFPASGEPNLNATPLPVDSTSLPTNATPVPTGMPDLDAILRQTISEAQDSDSDGLTGDSITEALPVVASVPTASSGQNGLVYEQDFSAVPVGEKPSDWTGDYDHASLTVDEQSGRNGGRALKFEKRSGAGSASYHCRFPKAAGHVIVEFDVRCDDKNKYLLGIYVEKDEDFKQSVHTIVHRLDSRTQPSLRVQGEPVPYQLGTWRQVKYDLNLLTGIVSAYVDDQQVVKDAKLPTIPSYINTLSIRDNLASTGVLYLGNIRIYNA